MSINTAHADNGVLIHAGENIILFSDNVNIELSGQDGATFKGTKTGKVYLTTHRIIFNNRNGSDPLHSLSMPFVCLSDVEIEQPVFGSNFIRGKIRAQPNGNFTGEAKFKMSFKSGGAIDFAQCALKAAYICKKYGGAAAPPPYTPPTGAWHQAPPPAYSASPMGYYGWVPQTQAFPNGPPPNTVYMSDNPPPYPGLVQPGAVPTANGYAGGPPTYPGNGGLPAYPGAYPAPAGAPYGGYPPANGGGYPQANGGGYPSPNGGGYPSPNGGGYPQPNGGGYPAPNTGGYPPANGAGYPAPNGGGGATPWANPTASVYPPMPNGGAGAFGGPVAGGSAYPPGPPQSSGAMGFSGPPGGKENEAAQSAFNPQPYPPQQPNAPPPEYNEPPPSYSSLANKKAQ